MPSTVTATAMKLSSYSLLLLAALWAGHSFATQVPPPPAEDPLVIAPPRDESRHAWTLIAMPLVVHWESSPDHRYSFAFAIERRNESTDFLQGFSLFRNSFGQPSTYAYIGQRWSNVWGNPNITFKLTGGILYGYVDKWKDRVPFNNNGFSPAVVPVLVYHLDRDQSFDVMVLGVGGLGFSYSKRF